MFDMYSLSINRCLSFESNRIREDWALLSLLVLCGWWRQKALVFSCWWSYFSQRKHRQFYSCHLCCNTHLNRCIKKHLFYSLLLLTRVWVFFIDFGIIFSFSIIEDSSKSMKSPFLLKLPSTENCFNAFLSNPAVLSQDPAGCKKVI